MHKLPRRLVDGVHGFRLNYAARVRSLVCQQPFHCGTDRYGIWHFLSESMSLTRQQVVHKDTEGKLTSWADESRLHP